MLDRRSFAATIGAIAVFTPRRTFAAVNQSKLARAVDLGSRNGGSGAIYYDGGRIAAWGDQNHKYSLKSSTKSFGSILLGLAIKENRVSINGKGQTYLAGFGTPPTSNKATGWPRGITLRHCATHTAGFDKKGTFEPLLFKYGTKWSYSDCGANWLADVLTVRFGQDLYAVLRSKILVPIGASSGVTWRANAYRPHKLNGIERREFGSGISASINAMGKVGLMLLDGGRGLISSDYIHNAGTPKSDIAALPQTGETVHPGANKHYGYLFWNNGNGAMAGVPYDAFWSWGLYDSFILTVPSLKLVAARAGNAWESGWGKLSALQPFFAAACAAVS